MKCHTADGDGLEDAWNGLPIGLWIKDSASSRMLVWNKVGHARRWDIVKLCVRIDLRHSSAVPSEEKCGGDRLVDSPVARLLYD